ncbi:GmrSD restriction endonuclease domain-containing protein [Campylobacter californiensis]|uniref:GmrSD restriction endonuclease domain-containing protein n=1 Tax=Campylobacter californiensis TaxID=1032243 RepID=UPI0014758FF1|nr:DUF262 domain-containing protein [Campylobacter sp. RM12916]MBE3609853.1 DUF262 domain-containing protein [Campylobacter sp. RM12916]
MDNKIYYGEYSLKHWINLILKRNIILPEYQRYFVWKQEKTKELIKAFKEKQFIPPITIGSFEEDGKNVNLILDGQQRLTSILLAYLGLFPDKKSFASKEQIGFADEDDNPIDEGLMDNILEWNFNSLVKKGREKNEIKNNIIDGNYANIDYEVDDDFFNNNFLGFSYLVPNTNDQKQQQNFYSKVFRNINMQGETLLPQESRSALYYLNKDLTKYFKPEFVNKIFVNDAKMDFVRYIALLSQYQKDGSQDDLAKGFARKMEKYYEEYIYSLVGENTSNLFVSYYDIFKDTNHEFAFNSIEKTLSELGLFAKYESIIDMDVKLFGLIYFIMFKKFKIELEKKDELLGELNQEIAKFKNVYLHKKNPSAIKYLKSRIGSSIEIYSKYAIRDVTYEQA